MFYAKALLITLTLLTFSMGLNAQLQPVRRWSDSVNKLSQEIFQLQGTSGLQKQDTAALKPIQSNLFDKRNSKFSKENSAFKIPQVKKLAFSFGGGFINYNYNYRSAIDTPFQEAGISQHLVTGFANMTFNEAIPITVSYFERQSNSKYFRDYRDVRVEFNAAEFQRIKAKKLTTYINSVSDNLRDPVTKPSLDYSINQLQNLDNWFNRRDVENKLIQSRIAVLNGGTIDSITHKKDTAIGEAKEFIALYNTLKEKQGKLKSYRDSLQVEYVKKEKQVAALKKIVDGNMTPEEKQKAVEPFLAADDNRVQKLKKLFGLFSSIQSFGVGKVLPNHSDLTLKNININGINFEYYRKFYFALSAGAIDYRARDFFNAVGKRKPQFVYLTRFGYGAKQGSHAYLTAFKGKKQLLSSSHNPTSLDIYGLSFESQFVLDKNHRIIGEIAQSASPSLISLNGPNEKPSFKLDDQKNKAWSVKLNSSFPKTRSRVEAYYKYRGINFQSFSSYYSNAALNSWQIKADQYLWKRQIRINLSVSKNNYENSELPVRYSGETSFTSASIYFKRKKWPSLQVGYMPSSQLSDINGQVYENFYHTLNATANHTYKLGLAQGFSIFSYNRFFNSSKDSGFIYYNAKNYYFSQLFQFDSYGANLNITRSESRDYNLTIFEGGVNTKIKKQHLIGFGVKINQLNEETLKVGLYGNGRIAIKNVGELSAWIEKTYLPGWGGKLVRNELYTIGFTRFFK